MVRGSIYSHKVLADVLPFKDLFLTVCFASVGLLIDLEAVWQSANGSLAPAYLPFFRSTG